MKAVFSHLLLLTLFGVANAPAQCTISSGVAQDVHIDPRNPPAAVTIMDVETGLPYSGSPTGLFSGVAGTSFDEREFAVICGENGILFVDVDSPLVGQWWFYADPVNGTHRGAETFGEFVYSTCGQTNGMRVFEIKPTTSGFLVERICDTGIGVCTPTYNNTNVLQFSVVQKLAIDKHNARLYVSMAVPFLSTLHLTLHVFKINPDGRLSDPKVLGKIGSGAFNTFDIFLRRFHDGGQHRTWAYLTSYSVHSTTPGVPSAKSFVIIDVTDVPLGPGTDTWDPDAVAWEFSFSPPGGSVLDDEVHSSYVTPDGQTAVVAFEDTYSLAFDISAYTPTTPASNTAYKAAPPPIPSTHLFASTPCIRRLHHFNGIGNTGYISAFEGGFLLVDMTKDSAGQPNGYTSLVEWDQWNPQPAGSNFRGVWNVDMDLDSGKLLVSERTDGLHILTVDRAHVMREGFAIPGPNGSKPRMTLEDGPPRISAGGGFSAIATVRDIPLVNGTEVPTTVFFRKRGLSVPPTIAMPFSNQHSTDGVIKVLINMPNAMVGDEVEMISSSLMVFSRLSHFGIAQ